MTITVHDPRLIEELARANDNVQLQAPDGRVIGHFVPEGLGKLPPGVNSPFTEAEMANRRKNQAGRPLADILRDLQARE